jgi:hypothetical protein
MPPALGGLAEEGSKMQWRGGKTVGLLTTVIGIVVTLIAVLLFGLTKTSNGETTVDWVSMVTAIGGLVIVGRGLYWVARKV